MNRASSIALVAFLAAGISGCEPSPSFDSGEWAGTIDTLPSGQIVVANSKDPLWPGGSEWRVVEELLARSQPSTCVEGSC